jgi:hypothetical protein
MLCLGSDAPIGDTRRLLRKIMLVAPTQKVVPRIYTSGADISQGPKIAVAYDDQVVLFSVPSDVFELSKNEQRPSGLSAAELDAASAWLEWWPKDDIPANYPRSSSTPEPGSGPRSIWPLFVRGTPVGKFNGLVDIAINNVGGRLSIWGFASDGRTNVWQIDDGVPRTSITEHNIARDGQVMDPYEVDADGDIVMEDAAVLTPRAEHPDDTQMDGSYSAIVQV